MLSWAFCSSKPGRWSSVARQRWSSSWPPVPNRWPDVADFREQTLIAEQFRPSGVAPVVTPGRTIGANSRLLYDLLGHVYDWLGFDAVGDAVFRDLVIARIVEPTSKLDASRVLADSAPNWCPTRPLTARNIHAGGYRGTIAEKY